MARRFPTRGMAVNRGARRKMGRRESGAKCMGRRMAVRRGSKWDDGLD